MLKICVQCGKEFEANHSGAKFCSYLCYRLNVKKSMSVFLKDEIRTEVSE